MSRTGLSFKAELPGVRQEGVRVALDEGLLTIAGQRQEDKETKDARYYARERFTGTFSRSFVLPDGVDARKVTAEYKDGPLEVRVPLPALAKAEPISIPVKG